jgi:hypothetical protein
MRVNIDRTVEVTDAQRAAIAKDLGQKAVTRAEIQEFIWQHGASWDRPLADPAVPEPEPPAEDLLGSIDPDRNLAAVPDPSDLI